MSKMPALKPEIIITTDIVLCVKCFTFSCLKTKRRDIRATDKIFKTIFQEYPDFVG